MSTATRLAALLLALCVPPLSAQDAVTAPAPAAPAAEPVAEPVVVVPRDWLVMPTLDARGRRPFAPDAVFAQHLLDPDAAPPQAEQELVGELGRPGRWTAVTADDSGQVTPPFAANWAHTTLHSDVDTVLLAQLSGAARLFVNGEAQSGDLYGLGFGGLPVLLRQGANEIYVSGLRGRFHLRLSAPEAPLLIALAEATRPDLVVGERPSPGLALSVTVINATLTPIPQLVLLTGGDGPFDQVGPKGLSPLGPLGVVKLPLPIAWRHDAPPPTEPGTLSLPITVGGLSGVPSRTLQLALDVRAPHAARRATYVSGVDGSVQEFALLPPAAEPLPAGRRAGDTGPALVLSLHGAGVHSLAQARSYSPKPDTWIVAPTNRRPFGFDWQDWGRRDAYDVLSLVGAQTGADPRRLMLTGHSMGGHGVWHLAVNDPDRFAAIAPSAGWASFDSYGGRPDGALAALWRGADLASETERLLSNITHLPTYVLHGSADDTVPAREAETLVAALRAAGGAPQLHLQEGAGHWWDGPAAAGADCVDWPGIFELFASSRRAPEPDALAVTIADPGVDARHHWLVALQPLQYGEPLELTARRELEAGAVTLTTKNARRLALQWPDDWTPPRVVIDGQELRRQEWDAAARHAGLLSVAGTDGTRSWRPFDIVPGVWPAPGEKSPERSGPFKRAFDQRFVLVHGTAGDDAEDARLFARARADASLWWYRGNGQAVLLPDTAWKALRQLPQFERRNVILYGNRDSNHAFAELVPEGGPFDARRGSLRLGERTWEGDDLLGLVVRPLPGDARGLLGLVADSGARGARLGDTLALFVSGVGYPDYALISSEVLAQGDGGVLAAGWFAHDWSLDAQP